MKRAWMFSEIQEDLMLYLLVHIPLTRQCIISSHRQYTYMTVTVSLSESDYKLVQILKARDDVSSDQEVIHKYLSEAIDPTEAEIIAELMEQMNEPDEPSGEETLQGIL